MICRGSSVHDGQAVSFDEGRRAGRRTTAGKRGGGGAASVAERREDPSRIHWHTERVMSKRCV